MQHPHIPQIKILFHHLHKAGGNSVREVLGRIYGPKSLCRLNISSTGLLLVQSKKKLKFTNEVYQAPDFDLSKHLNPNVSVIWGHFSMKNLQRILNPDPYVKIVWMRNPVDRVISHYYWKLLRKEKGQMIHADQLSDLQNYIKGDSGINYYARKMKGLPLESYDFIGFKEYFNEDIADLCRFLGHDKELIPQKMNQNEKYRAESKSVSQELIEEIKSYNKKDFALFEQALSIRNERRDKSNA